MKRKISSLIAILILAFLAGCCSEIYVGRQEVDVQPFYTTRLDLQGVKSISSLFDVRIFEQIEAEEDEFVWARLSGPNKKLPNIDPASNIDVKFILANTPQLARDNFNLECLGVEDQRIASDIEFGGEQDNQFCISSVKQWREPPEALCQPTRLYESFVVFQKDRLVITIDETIYSETGKDLNFSKNDVILLLAQELAK